MEPIISFAPSHLMISSTRTDSSNHHHHHHHSNDSNMYSELKEIKRPRRSTEAGEAEESSSTTTKTFNGYDDDYNDDDYGDHYGPFGNEMKMKMMMMENVEGLIWNEMDRSATLINQNLWQIPSLLTVQYASFAKKLDLSYNCLQTLAGIEYFNCLEELVLDNNNLNDSIRFFYNPFMQILSINKNKLTDLEKFLNEITLKLPGLTYLSMLGNPACPDQLSSSEHDEKDYRRYRSYVIYRMPQLKFLDSSIIKQQERLDAQKRGHYYRLIRLNSDSFVETNRIRDHLFALRDEISGQHQSTPLPCNNENSVPKGWHPRSSSSSTSSVVQTVPSTTRIQQQEQMPPPQQQPQPEIFDANLRKHRNNNNNQTNNYIMDKDRGQQLQNNHQSSRITTKQNICSNNKKFMQKCGNNKSVLHHNHLNQNHNFFKNSGKNINNHIKNQLNGDCDLNSNHNVNCDDQNNKFNDSTILEQEDLEKIEDWLDEHPEFTHNYVVRKAPRTLIDKWLLAHSSSMATVGTHFNNQNLTSQENSGANTPVRKISAHEFEASGGGFLRPMVSTTLDGTLTFLPIQDSSAGKRSDPNEISFMRNPATMAIKESTWSQEMLDDLNHDPKECLSPLVRSRASIISIRSREELESIKDEKELIFELVKDICNDLDVKSLCYKILKNVSRLTNADRCSLFLVRGAKSDEKSRYLVSQLFDVCGQSTIEQVSQNEEIIIPWGTGIVGHVACSGMAVNIPDCYQDSRFTNIIDIKTGYKTKNMLCNPIFDFNGEVMGVAQVINKKNSNSFDKNDENVFEKYLQFCGIGLRNAQLYERSQLENKRNQVLLDLARMVFEKQSNIENIIYRILIHVLSLLQCERCQIMLLTDDSDDWSYFGQFFQEHNPNNHQYYSNNDSNNMESLSQLRVNAPFNADVSASSECTSSNASITSETSSYYDLANNKSMYSQKIRSFYRVFDLQSSDLQQPDFEKTKQSPFEGRFPINIGITGYVAATGETLNIPDAYSDSRFDPTVDQDGSFRHKSILCMPIKNATRKIIGVAQLVNKLNDRPFNKNDENLFEAFAIFSGMGIENTQMFENAVKAMAKQKVTLELLSYHASANDQEATKFARMLIPSTSSLSLSSLRFNDFSLNEDQMIKACIRMFIDLDLIERFHIDYKVLCKWILSVRKNYRSVLYHNWRHAFNVTQMMFAIFVNTDMCYVLGELETLALVVACLCHDLDHRGTNNSFQIKTSSALAQLYSTSTLEHHHFDQSLMIINSKGNQILKNLSPEEYRRVVHVLEEAILATDLAIYFKKRDQFFELVDNKTYDWTKENHRSLLRSMLMTCCDIAAITKPWDTQKVVAELVASEFYHQGDIEKEQLNIEPIDMMNREKKEDLPKMQMSFIDSICMPIYDKFAKLYPEKMKILLNGVVENREAWSILSNQPYQLNIRQPGEEICSEKHFNNHEDDDPNGVDEQTQPQQE